MGGPYSAIIPSAGAAHPSVDPYEYVISANIRRRHLKPEDKLDLIARVLQAQPNKSDRTIAKQTKTSPTTVGKVRAKKEAAGELSTVDSRVGADNKVRKRPARAAGADYPTLDEVLDGSADSHEWGEPDAAAVSDEPVMASPPKTLLLLNCKDAARTGQQGLEYSGPVDDEILKAACKAAKAWAKLYDKLVGRSADEALKGGDNPSAEIPVDHVDQAVDQSVALKGVSVAEAAIRAEEYPDMPEFCRRTA